MGVRVCRHHRVESTVPAYRLGDQRGRGGGVEQVGGHVVGGAAQLGQERRYTVRVATVGLDVVVAGQAGEEQPVPVGGEGAGDRRPDADPSTHPGHQEHPLSHAGQ